MNTQCQNELVTFKCTLGVQSHDVGVSSLKNHANDLINHNYSENLNWSPN